MEIGLHKNIPAVEFDAEKHQYTLGGRVLPSVTQIINSILPGWQADEWYMQRGTATHYGCQLLDAGQLDWESVAPEIVGRLRAWDKFRAEHKSEVIESELLMAHPIYGFAGTLDRVLVNASGIITLIDIKQSISPQVKLQLGAYKILYDECGTDDQAITEAAAVALSDDAKYTTLWMTRRELERAGRVFLGALSVHGFKMKEGIK